MKILWTTRLIGKGALAPSDEWTKVRDSAVAALRGVHWPEGSKRFTINPQRKANGVNPIKKLIASQLAERGWSTEQRWPIPDISKPGNMDGAYKTSHGLVGFEWETGNVASSHRSINKMCLGLTIGTIAGGILALSARNLAQYLTDRVATVEEIQAYFPLWQATPCERGVLEIVVVTYDKASPDVPLIPKVLTGRAV